MPVNIYRVLPDGGDNVSIAWLCDNEWSLPPQIDTLCAWLKEIESTLSPAEYVADVGFGWRRDARSGGPVLEPADMARMVALGMSLFLSEYGGFSDEFTTPSEAIAPSGS